MKISFQILFLSSNVRSCSGPRQSFSRLNLTWIGLMFNLSFDICFFCPPNKVTEDTHIRVWAISPYAPFSGLTRQLYVTREQISSEIKFFAKISEGGIYRPSYLSSFNAHLWISIFSKYRVLGKTTWDDEDNGDNDGITGYCYCPSRTIVSREAIPRWEIIACHREGRHRPLVLSPSEVSPSVRRRAGCDVTCFWNRCRVRAKGVKVSRKLKNRVR